MITHNKTGGRTVELFIPFDYNGKRVESITFSALRFGNVLRWNGGEYATMMDLMIDLAGVENNLIRELRYPDTERVIEAFMALMTPEIRQNIAEGQVPTKMEQEQAPQRATNGSAGQSVEEMMEEVRGIEQRMQGKMQGPGAPLPETGFDMSEEP